MDSPLKLGVTYSVFSGLDLLKPSVVNIRPFAKHIVVVWSAISSTGEPAVPYMLPLLKDLVRTGLVDELIEQKPVVVSNPAHMQDNCRIKRELGRQACVRAGCTHHLIRDCDEFHDPLQLTNVLGAYPVVDCTLTQLYEYVGAPTNRLRQMSGVYVPFIQKADKPLQARFRPFGLMCDGGRTVGSVRTWHVFEPCMLALHHYTFVRYDDNELQRKYQGHGHCHRIGSLGQFLAWADRFTLDDIEQVPDVFGIKAYWAGEFQQWLK